MLTNSFFGWDGAANERPGTDHVTSGPTGGLEKNASDGADGQSDRQTDRQMATL